eukprot:Tbor_TRINITY_DN1141_c0_g1::TRINITY_DN1141_c0_g1_i1::g.15564::m.15564
MGKTTQRVWRRVRHEDPPSCCCSSQVHYKNNIYVFGGSTLRDCYSDLFAFNLTTLMWRKVITEGDVALVKCRISHTAVLHEGTMVVYGGASSNFLLDGICELNLDSNVWRYIAPIDESWPFPRILHSSVMYKGKMFVLMGQGLVNSNHDDFWCYDIITRVWEKLRLKGNGSAPPMALNGHSATVIDDSMFVFGGVTTLGSYSNSLYSYNFLTEVWSEVQVPHFSMKPHHRYCSVLLSWNRQLFLHGGDTDQCTRYFNDLWTLKPYEDPPMWLRLDTRKAPSARSGHSASVVSGVLHIFGGESPAGSDVTFSNEMLSLTIGYPVESPLRDLASRWLGSNGGLEDDLEWYSLPYGGVRGSLKQSMSLVTCHDALVIQNEAAVESDTADSN